MSKQAGHIYKKLFEMCEDAVVVVDKESGQIECANPYATKIYGYSNEELLKLKNTDLSAEINHTKRATRNGNSHILLRYHKNKKGEVFPVEILTEHIEEDGRQKMLQIIKDISLSEKNGMLSDSEHKYQMIINNLRHPMVCFSLDGRLIMENSFSAEVMGFKPGENLGKYMEEYLPESITAHVRKAIDYIIEHETRYDYEIYIEQLNMYVLTYALPLYNRHGKLIGIQELSRNVTTERENEKQIRENLENQKLLNKIANYFLKTSSPQEKIDKSLEIMGKHLGVSRVYIFENYNGGTNTKNIYEWCNEGVQPEIDNLQEVDFVKELPSWKKLVYGEGILIASDIKDLPRDAYEILAPQNIKSILCLPLYVRNKEWGFIGFDECEEYREWHPADIELLKTLSSIISYAIEHDQSEKELRNSERKFRTIFDNSSDAIFINDMERRVVEVNKRACDLFGFSREEFLAMEKGYSRQYGYPPISDEEMAQINKKLEQNELVCKEASYLTKKGEVVNAELNSTMVSLNGRYLIISLVRNLEARKERERMIMQAVLEGEENERQRISENLHDDIGPLLSTVKIYTGMLQKNEYKEEERKQMQKYVNQLLDDSINGIRNIANNLMPAIISDYGLIPAVRTFCNQINATRALKVELNNDKMEGRLPANVETNMFRVIKELLNNTLKHAEASQANIVLERDSNQLKMTYTDYGKGYHPNSLDEMKAKGHGIQSMESRLRSMKGQIQFNNNNNNNGIKVESIIQIENEQN